MEAMGFSDWHDTKASSQPKTLLELLHLLLWSAGDSLRVNINKYLAHCRACGEPSVGLMIKVSSAQQTALLTIPASSGLVIFCSILNAGNT